MDATFIAIGGIIGVLVAIAVIVYLFKDKDIIDEIDEAFDFGTEPGAFKGGTPKGPSTRATTKPPTDLGRRFSTPSPAPAMSVTTMGAAGMAAGSGGGAACGAGAAGGACGA